MSCSTCQRRINEAKLHSGQGHFFKSEISIFKKQKNLDKGSFFNYVDKTKLVGGTGNVNGTYILTYKSKGIPSPMSTRGRKVGGQ